MKTSSRHAPILAAILAAATPTTARALDFRWGNSFGGTFSTGLNWLNGSPPGTNDVADFGVVTSGTGPTYTVNFTTSPTNLGLVVHRDSVTFNLAAHTYTLSGITGADTFLVGQNAGESGSLTLSGGTLISNTSSSSFQSAIGQAATATGSVTINSGATWTDSAEERIGESGTGTIHQTGGSHFVSGVLNLGFNAGANGTYLLSGGTLTVAGSSANIGGRGTGAFTQTGGSASFQTVVLGANTGSHGTLTINDPSGLASFSGTTISIGNFDKSTLNLTNGTMTFTNFLSNANGTINFSGGTINASNVIINNANFTWTGGTFNVTGASGLTVGSASSFNDPGIVPTGGTLSVTHTLFVDTGGFLSVIGGKINAGSDLQVGSTSSGLLTETSGNISVLGNLIVGNSAGSSGTVTIDGANASVSVIGSIELGGSSSAGGIGGLNINSGTVSANGIRIWDTTGTSLNLSGGSLAVSTFNASGNPARFNWTGGTLSMRVGLTIGTLGPLGSSLTISGTKSLLVFNLLRVDSGGLLTISGGNVTAQAAEIIGNQFSGSVTQSAGTHTVGDFVNATDLDLAASSGSSGTYDLTGGTLTVQHSLYIGGSSLGAGGTGVFNISGGVLTVNNSVLKVWNTPGSGLNVSSGLLSLGSLDLSGNLGLLNWTGGELSFPTITLDNAFVLGSTLYISTGKTLAASGFTLTPQGFFRIAGGTFRVFTLDITANPNGFAWDSGTLDFVQDLAIATAGPLGPAITLASNKTLSAGGTINNSASLDLAGGTVAPSAIFFQNPLLNNTANGVISGPGVITMPLANAGLITLSTGTLFLPDFTNAGVIELGGLSANLAPGANITNAGTIEGFGKVAANVTNNGVLEATGGGGGTLLFTGNLTNNPTGTIAVGTGNKILIQGAAKFPTNAGLISLTGGTFDTANQPLDNTGQISGYGTLRTGGLTNDGSITFTGGTSTINGPLTNAASRTLNIKYQPAIFTGNVTNNGTIKVTSTTATFTATFTNNGSYLSDPATNIFSANVAIGSGGSMTGSTGDEFHFTGGSLQNSGTFSNGGLLQSSAAVSNAGSFTQSGPQSWSTGTTFTNTAGSANFASDAGSPAASPLSLTITGGTVHLATPQHLHALSLNAGTLDLDLTTPGSANANVQLAATNALTLNGGNLTFTNHPTGPASLGYYKTLQYTGTIQGAGPESLILPATQNDIAYTLDTTHDPGFIDLHRGLLGDANDDGTVDFADFAILSNNFGDANATWSTGDFNNDGLIDFADFALLSNNFGGTIGAFDVASASGGAASGVPEPASLLLLGAGLVGVLGTRRRVRRS